MVLLKRQGYKSSNLYIFPKNFSLIFCANYKIYPNSLQGRNIVFEVDWKGSWPENRAPRGSFQRPLSFNSRVPNSPGKLEQDKDSMQHCIERFKAFIVAFYITIKITETNPASINPNFVNQRLEGFFCFVTIDVQINTNLN